MYLYLIPKDLLGIHSELCSSPDKRLDPLYVLHVEVVEPQVPQHLVLPDHRVRPPADPSASLPLGKLVMEKPVLPG